MEDTLIIALEIGSSKIKGATGAISQDGSLSIRAVEVEPISDIVRYGCIRNIVETERAVQNVLSRLELRESPRKVQGVYLSIGGRSMTSRIIEIERQLPHETLITKDLIDGMAAEAREYNIPGHKIIAAEQREVVVNNEITSWPIGAIGSHILIRYSVISCRSQLYDHLRSVVEDRMGLKIMGIFPRPAVQADMVLLDEEKRLGCMLVDFGAETTSVAIYRGGSLERVSVIPMGSRNITRDITSLNVLEESAEELKRTVGSAESGRADNSQRSSLPGQPDAASVNNYVAARAAEIILNIVEQVKHAGLQTDKLPKGIVIVGNGAKLNGFTSRLEQLSGMMVRVGSPSQSRMRILDGRIQPYDSIDVLSILRKALDNPKECFTPAPKPEQPVQQPIAETPAVTQPAPAPMPNAAAKEPVRNAGNKGLPPKPEVIRKKSFTKSFGEKINKITSHIGESIGRAFDEDDDE